ncbi:MAG: hypothetical protein V4467_00585 [Patescibacteria group bacterium]
MSDPKTVDTKDGASNAFKNITEPLKKALGGTPDLNTFLSLLNPFLSDSAEAAAAKAKKSLGNDHWLCSRKGESVIGVIAAQIENYAATQKDPLQGALMKAADWFEAFAEALRSKDGDPATAGKVTARASSAGITKLDEEFLQWAQGKLQSADLAQIAEVEAEILKKAEARERLKKLAAEGLPPVEKPVVPKPPKEPGTPWTEVLDAQVTEWEATRAARNAEIVPYEPNWLSRLLLWPWKILGGLLFGFPKSKKKKTFTRRGVLERADW